METQSLTDRSVWATEPLQVLPSRKMNLIYLMFAVAIVPAMIRDWLAGWHLPVAIMVGQQVSLAVFAILQRRGYVGLATGLLAYSTLAAATGFIALSSQGFHNSATLLFPMVLVLGALMLTHVGYVILAIAVVLSVLGLYVLQTLGIVPLDPAAADGIVLVVLIILTMTGIVSAMLVGQIRLHLLAVKESEARMRSLSDASPEGIMIHRQGLILDTNLAFARMFGYRSPTDLVGLNGPELLFTPESRAAMEQRLRSGLHGVVRVSGIKRDGSLLSGEAEAHAFTYGGVVAELVTIQDVTARDREVEARLESDERYRALFERSLDCVFLTDLDGRFTDANTATLNLFGYTRQELSEVTFESLLSDEQRHLVRQKTFETLSAGFHQTPAEYHVRHKDGTCVPVEVQSSLILRDNRPVAIQAIARNLTERYKAAAETARLQDQLYSANKMESIGRLAGGIAHDFNNLLTVILGYNKLVLAKLGENHPALGHLMRIRRAAQAAAELTSELLTFSRKHALKTQLINLTNSIRDAAPMLKRLVGEDISVCIPDDLPDALVRANPNQLQQVLMNLAANARDAMPSGGTLTLTIAPVLTETGQQDGRMVQSVSAYRLMVTDTGPGISSDALSRIFEPFFTTKGEGRGTGLGLSIVYGIIRQFGGTIAVNSQLGVGTTFAIDLPANPDLASNDDGDVSGVFSEESSHLFLRNIPRGNETILVAEDRIDVRELTVTMLRSWGYLVLDAGSSESALNLAASYEAEIHLLLTDIVMPGMSGREMAATLKHLRPSLEVLFMSGFDPAAALAGEPPETHSFLQKPFSWLELATRIRTLLDSCQARRVTTGTEPGKGAILILDDDALVRELFLDILGQDGHTPLAVSDWPSAAALLEKRDIDVVLSDLSLPGDNGYDIVARLRRDFPQVRVVLMSGVMSESIRQKALSCGADAAVEKAGPEDWLSGVLDRLLGAQPQVTGKPNDLQ